MPNEILVLFCPPPSPHPIKVTCLQGGGGGRLSKNLSSRARSAGIQSHLSGEVDRPAETIESPGSAFGNGLGVGGRGGAVRKSHTPRLGTRNFSPGGGGGGLGMEAQGPVFRGADQTVVHSLARPPPAAPSPPAAGAPRPPAPSALRLGSFPGPAPSAERK